MLFQWKFRNLFNSEYRLLSRCKSRKSGELISKANQYVCYYWFQTFSMHSSSVFNDYSVYYFRILESSFFQCSVLMDFILLSWNRFSLAHRYNVITRIYSIGRIQPPRSCQVAGGF